MKNSKKKSPAKSKKKSKKNPLRKYQTAGSVVTPTPALGSSSFAPSTGIQIGAGAYGGSNAMTTNPYSNPNGLNGGFQIGEYGHNMGTGNAPSLPNPNTLSLGNAYGGNDLSLDRTATSTPGNSGMFDTKVEGLNEMKSLDLTPKPEPINKTNQALDGIGAAMPGVGLVTNLVKDSSIKDPSGYYDKKTKASLEKYNRKINAASAASSVGQGMLATASAWGPLAWIPAAVGGITVGASEGAKASYRAKQGNLGEDYDTRVADRVKYKESQAQRRQENLDRNAATNYYDQGSGLAKYGGMREYQMGGEYQKVNGPSHEKGGIDMDLSGDGVDDSNLEGGEIIEEMKHGGNAPKKYIWSDHLKTGGMSFAKKFEKLRKGGARPGDVETLRIEQEIAAKRDPSKLYAKYGGMHKYQTGGNKKEVLSSDISEVWQNDTLSPDFIRRPLSIDDSKVWQDDKLSPDFINKEKQAKVYKENSIPKKKSGGLMKYTKGGVSRTGAGKFFAEYGAPMANVAGEAVNIGMNLSQKYNPVETVNARELTADKIYIDRAKDKQAGFRESELMGAKRASRATTGTGATQRENALRMTSLRAGEMAAQNIYEQNRQASTDEQKINLEAQMRVDEANRQTDIVESESRRNEGLRKESFENMRKKYIGSVAGQLGNELASGMYRKEYINATLPDGVDPYELRAGAIARKQQEINPATGELYTLADADNAVLMQLQKERQAKAAKKAARKKGP